MLHVDLGQRAPLCNCPTRVNPEIKKAYARDDSFNTPKKEYEKNHDYSILELSTKLKISPESFRYYAKKLTTKDRTDDLFDDEVMMVFNHLKTHKIRRAMKRSKK